MNLFKIYLTVLLGLAVFSCHPSSDAIIDPVVTDDLVIQLERGECFGRCPAYVLTISSDGSVTFDGRHFTRLVGVAHDRVTQEEVVNLVSQFRNADFLEFDNSYNTNCQDGGFEIITFTQNGKTKSVVHAFGCKDTPDRSEEIITNLGRQIDAVARSDRWTKIDK